MRMILAFSWNVQYSPKITPNGFQYVHHMLIYLCNSFNETEAGNSAPCGGMTGASVSECRQGSLIAGWAVGGTVSSYPSENYHTLAGTPCFSSFILVGQLLTFVELHCVFTIPIRTLAPSP